MLPRSVAARLFLAIAAVSVVAFGLGVVLVERALRVDIRDEVTLIRSPDGSPVEHSQREISHPPDPIGMTVVGRRLVIALGVVLACTALATGWLARRIVQPVANLRAASGRIAAGDYQARVAISGPDELATLGRAFNSMADRLAENETRRRDLTNDVAHELRTPLTNLRCHLEALADHVTSFGPDTPGTLLGDVAFLERVVDDLADLARADAGQLPLRLEAVALDPVVDGLTKELAPRLTAGHIAFRRTVPATLPPLKADVIRLIQVLRNLLDNAITHTPPGGTISLDARADGATVTIAVTDSGPGIAPEHRDRVFDRFYRTDPARARTTGGAGLGLAIVRQLVQLHGGDVRAASADGHGAVFVVTWPTP